MFAAGIQGTLIDPQLELHDSTGALVATNDDWQNSNDAGAVSAIGLAPNDTREAAIRTSLEPGSYTAIVRGKNQTSGVALVEIYRG